MPLHPHDLRFRSIARPRPIRQEPDIPFDDLIFLVAEGIADAQAKLDTSTADLLETLATTEVDIVPRITRTIEADGSVSSTSAATESRSLLELGFTPTRYQFSEATVELHIDMSVAEEETRDSEEQGRHLGLRAGTYEVTEQRKYDRTIESNTTLTARLEPTPLPIELPPIEDRHIDAGGDDGD